MSKARLQHASPERKYLLRKRLMRWLDGIAGAVYCPFAGDLSIALGGRPEAERDFRYPFPGLYADRAVYGVDLDEDLVAIARKRLTNGLVRCADANEWAFGDVDLGPVAIFDHDAFDQPFESFRAAWENVDKAPRVMLAFTTAGAMGCMVDGTLISPADGSSYKIPTLVQRRQLYYQHLGKVVWAFLVPYLAADGFRVLDRSYYVRGQMVYCACIAEREDCDLRGMIR